MERAPRRRSRDGNVYGRIAGLACQREPRPAILLALAGARLSARAIPRVAGRSIQRGRRGGRMETGRKKESERERE